MPTRFTGLFTRLHARICAPICAPIWNDQKGATALEYGFIAALISLGGIAAFGALGDSISDMFLAVNSDFSATIPGGDGGGDGGASDVAPTN